MAQIYTALLLTSGIGTALALILTLLKPITRKVFSGTWHYYMWLTVLLVMVLPIRLNLPEKPVTTPISETVSITDNQIENTETPILIETQPEQIIQEQATQPEKVSTVQVIKDFLSGKVLLFSFIWLMGAVLLFLIKIISYLIFLIKIHRHSDLISCPEVKAYTNRKIRTRVSDTICSPLMIGIIRPTLLLPKTNITSEQLDNVLAHEMTHLKRNDILYKWFVSIVKCIHWFNPAIYLISKQISIDCEISCDLAVVKEMNEQQEKGYVETILALLTHNNSKAIPLTTGMTGNKKTLKRRFTMIKKKIKVSKKVAIISGILAVLILATTVFASGTLNGTFFETDNNSIMKLNTNNATTQNEKSAHKPNLDNQVSGDNREIQTMGLSFEFTPNTTWIQNIKLTEISGNYSEINYYDSVLGSNCKMIISKEKPLSFPQYCFSNSLDQTWQATEKPVTIKVQQAVKEEVAVATWNYENFNFAIIGEEVGTDNSAVSSIPKTAIFIINSMQITNKENKINSFVWPCESTTISNGFGNRVHPITGEVNTHNGIDISAPENSPVVSAIQGKVIDTGFDNEFGNYIIIENDNGVKLYYGHLSAVEVAKGDKVEVNTVIGKVGKTGTATGANLHFEIQINGEYKDPEQIFSR